MSTLSTSSLIDPTLYAPTAAKEKNPCSQCPNSTALSFRANRPGIVLAAQGATVRRSPTEYKTSGARENTTDDGVVQGGGEPGNEAKHNLIPRPICCLHYKQEHPVINCSKWVNPIYQENDVSHELSNLLVNGSDDSPLVLGRLQCDIVPQK